MNTSVLLKRKIGYLGLRYYPGLMISSFNPCMQGLDCDSFCLALVPNRGLSSEAVPAGAGGCPLQQLGSGWVLKQPLAAALSSGQRKLWKFRLCCGFLCY